MSTHKPKKKGHAQTHQNKEKWHHNPNSVLTKKILSIQHYCLCYRCEAQIEWRKTYRKYKPLKSMRRCNGCSIHAVNRAYHTFCDPCATARGICAKCGITYDITKKVKPMSDSEILDIVKRAEVKERFKRTILRNWERGLFYNDDIVKMIDILLTGETIMWENWIINDEEEEDANAHVGHSHGPDGKCGHSHAVGGEVAGTMQKTSKLDLSELLPEDTTVTTTSTTTATTPATEADPKVATADTLPVPSKEQPQDAQPETTKKKITILPKQTTSRVGAMSSALKK